MIPTPILTVLSTFRKNGVQSLLMGGQACVFYGAAQVSKDVDLALLSEPANIERLRAALKELAAERIAVPPFDPALFDRGHAIHFRCHAPDVEGLRVDLMSKLRLLEGFNVLWQRRTVFVDDESNQFNLLSVPDLVRSKKTGRNKDWPVIELLVNIHIHENLSAPKPDWIHFWLTECRTPLIASLDVEMRAEQAVDRAYWEPVRRELEAMRLDEARKKRDQSSIPTDGPS